MVQLEPPHMRHYSLSKTPQSLQKLWLKGHHLSRSNIWKCGVKHEALKHRNAIMWALPHWDANRMKDPPGCEWYHDSEASQQHTHIWEVQPHMRKDEKAHIETLAGSGRTWPIQSHTFEGMGLPGVGCTYPTKTPQNKILTPDDFSVHIYKHMHIVLLIQRQASSHTWWVVLSTSLPTLMNSIHTQWKGRELKNRYLRFVQFNPSERSPS